MRQFKTGDKVRFRQDGEFGNMNKYMYANNVMLDREYEVIDITGGVARIISYGLYFDVPLGCLELVPEPQPKLDNIKVGDWVELAYGIVAQLTSPPNDNRMFASLYDVHGKWQGCVWADSGKNTHIIRILSPKEVIMDFSSGISGTIEKDESTESIWVRRCWLDPVARIWLNHLDPQTRAKVESILKAQEEE